MSGSDEEDRRIGALISELGHASNPEEGVERLRHLRQTDPRSGRLLRKQALKILAARDGTGPTSITRPNGRETNYLNPMHASAIIGSMFIGSSFHPDMSSHQRQQEMISQQRDRVLAPFREDRARLDGNPQGEGSFLNRPSRRRRRRRTRRYSQLRRKGSIKRNRRSSRRSRTRHSARKRRRNKH